MALSIVIILLYFALFFLLFTSIILIRNRFELTSLPEEKSTKSKKISVCIPARNEEEHISILLESLEQQKWPDFEVHVLDDQSTDMTYHIAESYQKKFTGRFFVHRGEDKPDDWLGKPWACHQLQKKCDGDILLFLDADTRLYPGAISRVASSFDQYDIDMLTVWPKQDLKTFWEKTVIPVVFYALVTLLPAIYVYRDPRWLPKSLRVKFRTKFAAACGQCLAFKREAYDAIGGHESVKNKVVEDVELAKQLKKNGFTLRMFDGIGTVSCRMYQNEGEIFEGLRKNFLEGFNNSLPAFLMAGLLHLVVYVLPFISIFFAIFLENSVLFFLSVSCISLILIHRLIISNWYRLDPIYSFTHPIGVLWFQWLAIVKIQDYVTGRSTQWKGRNV